MHEKFKGQTSLKCASKFNLEASWSNLGLDFLHFNQMGDRNDCGNLS